MLRELKEHPRLWKKRLKYAAAERVKTNTSKYSKAEREIELTIIGQKQRCLNPDNASYPDYGGRGIEFRFESNEAAIKWVIKNIGPKPKNKTLDRIDNDRHYEQGNLRWATNEEQARNKRRYKRTPEGERLRRLAAIRTDYSEQGLLRYIKNGFTDEQIITMAKPPGGRKKNV